MTKLTLRMIMRAPLLILSSSLLLSACGGGAETTATPLSQDTGNVGDAAYSGEVARDADVLKFQQEFWAKARGSDRCGSCHNEVAGQTPLVRSQR